MFVRYQAVEPNGRGVRVGVFALVNGLAAEGALGDEDERWRRDANAWYTAAYSDPSDTDPSVYDRSLHPGAVAWFKLAGAEHLLDRLEGYLRLLDRHGVAWQRIISDDPGDIVYDDDVQVVAVPRRISLNQSPTA